MKRSSIQLITLTTFLLIGISVNAQGKLFKDSSIANKIAQKFSKAFKEFSGNQTYL